MGDFNFTKRQYLNPNATTFIYTATITTNATITIFAATTTKSPCLLKT